jgi:nucleotide-binding universal stress UspA family protein
MVPEATAALDEVGLRARTQIRAGHSAQQIVRAAADHHADVIVIGGSGHSGV